MSSLSNARKRMNSALGQAEWKNAKQGTAIEELQKQNKELVDALNYFKQRDESFQRVVIYMLFQLGGVVEISHEDLAATEGRIMVDLNEETKINRFYIAPLEEKQIQ